MGIDNTNIQRKSAFYHALGKVLTEENNSIAGEKYKSAHSVNTKEIWVDSIAYCADLTAAQNEANINDALTMVGTPGSPARLYPLQGTNYQSWFLDTGTPTVTITGCIPSDGWVKPLINPSDISNNAGAPSNGFLFNMYRPNGNGVNYLTTYWEVDYYAGIVNFQPTKTPGDSTSNLGFQTTALNSTNTASLSALNAMLDNTTTGGPHAVAFQYTGQYLDDYLENIPSGGGGGGGSQEWQASVNGYLTEIGGNQTIDGFTDINEQIQFLSSKYDNYYVKTDSDITGVSPSWGITDPDSYYEFDGASFSAYTITTNDDENRFLLVDNDITLDVVEISATGSVTEYPNTTIQKDRLIEYTGTASTGLSYAAWQVTDPRIGMVTTLDNQEFSLVRYVGVGSGWVEYAFESTYKVDSQKDMEANTTADDYDIAVGMTVSFEPSGSKTIDVLLNGVEMPSDVYAFGSDLETLGYPGTTPIPTNKINIGTGQTVNPQVGYPIFFDTGTMSGIERIVTNVESMVGDIVITYAGDDVPSFTNVYIKRVLPRSNRVARKGDYLLWKGSNWYQLSGDNPKDLITFKYVTMDSGALNI